MVQLSSRVQIKSERNSNLDVIILLPSNTSNASLCEMHSVHYMKKKKTDMATSNEANCTGGYSLCHRTVSRALHDHRLPMAEKLCFIHSTTAYNH
jgi:hypothetical protein